MPPVPDMSMPFNVISLTCTLYAFVVGSLANLLVRKSSSWAKKALHPEEHKSTLQQLKEKLRSKSRLFGRKGGEPRDNVGNSSETSVTKDTENDGPGNETRDRAGE